MANVFILLGAGEDECGGGFDYDCAAFGGSEAVGLDPTVAGHYGPVAFGNFGHEGRRRAVEHQFYLFPFVAVGVVFDGIGNDVWRGHLIE